MYNHPWYGVKDANVDIYDDKDEDDSLKDDDDVNSKVEESIKTVLSW